MSSFRKGDIVVLLKCTHWKNNHNTGTKWCQITKPCVGQVTEVTDLPGPDWAAYNFPSDKAICLVRHPITGYDTWVAKRHIKLLYTI